MNYEDYVCGDDHVYDFESDLFSNMATAEPWDVEEDEWDPFSDWVYEGEFTDTYDDYYG